MHIYCLTRLITDGLEEKVPETYRYHYFNDRKYHCDKIKDRILRTEFENSKNYAFSEVRIGKINNVKIAIFVMTKGLIKVHPPRLEENKPIQKENDFVDLIINKEMSSSNIFPKCHIKEIRIRCVKVFTSKISGICESAQNDFKRYAEEVVKEVSRNLGEVEFFTAQENAFDKIKPLKIQNEATEKAINQKITDLYVHINNICDPQKGNKKRIYYSNIKHEVDYAFDSRKKKYIPRDENHRDYSTCSTLTYEFVKVSKINIRWFNAPSLVSLNFRNCDAFQTFEAWKIFEKNISKLTNLHILEISRAGINELSANFFLQLPPLMDSLIFEGNNLRKIPVEIKNVKNLKFLSLTNNPNMTTAGIPWNVLPESLELFQFWNTNINELPPEIKRLKNLKQLDAYVQNIKEFKINDLAESVKRLAIKNTTVTTPMCTTGLDSLILTHSNLKDLSNIEIWEHIGLLNLSHNDFETFSFLKPPETYRLLRKLDLSHNKLTTFPWDILPEKLTYLNLSHNFLTSIDPAKSTDLPRKFWKTLQYLQLQNNQLTSMTNEINQSRFLIHLDLSHNHLIKLDEGFEKCTTINYLNLSHNHFDYKNQNGNLFEDLWLRLPQTLHLLLNVNKLHELPCQMINKFSNLHVMECNLKYICPQIYSSAPNYGTLNINSANNPDIKLTFVPKTILYPPYASETQSDRYDEQFESETFDFNSYESKLDCVLLSDNNNMRDTSEFKKGNNKFIYYFDEVIETEFEEQLYCKCCATCNEADVEKIMIEQLMVMDFSLSVVKLEEIKEDIKSIGTIFDDYPAWDKGKWKTNVRTRLCYSCLEKLKEKIDLSNKEYAETKILKNLAKRARLDEPMDDSDKNQKQSQDFQQQSSKNQTQIDPDEPNIIPAVSSFSNIDVPMETNPEQPPQQQSSLFYNPETQSSSAIQPPNLFYDLHQTQSQNPVELGWIEYGNPEEIQQQLSDLNWPYFFPTEIYLKQKCCVFPDFPFSTYAYQYVFENNLYGYSICGLTKILAKYVVQDESSGFRALSWLLTGNENLYEILRRQIRNHILSGHLPDTFYHSFPVISDSNDPWLQESDFYAAAHLFEINILVFTNEGNTKWNLYNESFVFDQNRYSLLLSNADNYGYNAVVAATPSYYN